MSGLSRRLFGFACAIVLSSTPLVEAGFTSTSISRSVKQAATNEPLRTATDRKVNIRNIKLELRVDLEKKTVVSQASIQFQAMRPTRTLSLDAVGFEVKKVMLAQGDKPSSQAQFTHDGKKLSVELGNNFTTGQTGTVNVEYVVQTPRSGLHFFGPSKTNPDIPLQVWSQGETITNRYWIPCVDEPNQRQTTQVIVTVPMGFEAISNGKLLSRKENPDEKTVTFDWFQDKPHPSYLITLVVGQFDVVQEDWNGVPVMYYVPKGRKAEALPTYGKTRDMLTFFSTRFGITYPWDKYAQICAYQFGGGMENTSATTMGEGILKDQRSLLDGNSEWIVSHELAHQWWGDMVTCRDWSHTWLNEGFASYAEALWDEHRLGRDDYALNMYQKAASAIPAGRNRPIMDRRYPNPDSMFDGRSYPKAAWVLHMLRNRLGDEAFFKCVKEYGTQYKFQSVETGDLRRMIERVTDRGLERFFYDWLERPGNPNLDVTTEYKPDSREVKVVVKQTQTAEPFYFPMKVNIYCAGSTEPTVLEEEMRDKELTLKASLPGVLERVEIDPDQAVLATLKETKPRELWSADLLHGSTVPVRLRAAQHFKASSEAADRELVVTAFKQEKFHAVKIQLANGIGDSRLESGRDALIAGLADSDARIRHICLTNLAKYQKDEKAIEAIRTVLQKGDESYAVEGAAVRSYGKLGQKDAVELLTPWLSKQSHQNTLANSALNALSDLADPATLESVLPWTETNRPRNCRSTALRTVVQLIKSKKLSDAQNQAIVKSFANTLQSEDQFLHFGMLDALQEMGKAAEPALSVVEKLAESLPAGNLKETAKKTVEKIRGGTKEGTSKDK